jgi:hypothetical protein
MDRIIACWEDSFGAWVVSKAPPESPNVESLETHWARLVAGTPSTGETAGGDDKEKVKAAGTEDESSVKRYGEAVGLLVQVAEILEVCPLPVDRWLPDASF